MLPVLLKPFFHRGAEQMGIFFKNDTGLNLLVRNIPGIKWSQTQGCWYVSLQKENCLRVIAALQCHAAIDRTPLQAYLAQKQKIAATLPGDTAAATARTITTSPVWQLSAENLLALQQLVQQLKLKAYSPSTIRTYRNEFVQLLKLLQQKHVNELAPGDLRRYLLYIIEKERVKEHTVHSRINAIKFYFEQVLGREKFFWEVPRPKKRQELPKTFNQDEIAAIINSVTNTKHKTMLMLAYSAGLRVSEVVRLKTPDIDSRRMAIFIRQAKGKKDRMALLSPVMLVMLRAYAREYRPAPDGYLFEGLEKGSPYSARSLQEVIHGAKQKAGILRPGSIHCLRHSFATHLVDRGTDVTMIQKLLGHNSIKTTLRYLHTTNKDLLKIISPLDGLKLS